MLSHRRNILICKTRPQFSKEPARPFRNLSLGGIARPNIIYVSKFGTLRNIRELEKVMSESTNAYSDRQLRNLKSPKKRKIYAKKEIS